MTTKTDKTSEHYHVVAVQDWGGSQEYWRGWDDQFTRKQAEQLAADMVEADTAYLCGPCDGTDVARFEAALAKYGDRFSELISGNVCPGWNAIWLMPCKDPCDWTIDREPVGAPWWRRGVHPAELPEAAPLTAPF